MKSYIRYSDQQNQYTAPCSSSVYGSHPVWNTTSRFAESLGSVISYTMAALLHLVVALVIVASLAQAQQFQQQFQPPQQFQPRQPFQPQQPFQPGGSFACPTPMGQFPYPQDCTKFYRCDNSVAVVTDCQAQLVFNSQSSMCDWPANVPSCTRPNNQQLFKSDIGNLCDRNPYGGIPTETFHVRHPRMCNAFFTCTQGFMHGQCTFCPEGAYFNRFAGGCRELPAGIINTDQICDNLPMIGHGDKAKFSVSEHCWPFANIRNPWEQLANLYNVQLPFGQQQWQNQN